VFHGGEKWIIKAFSGATGEGIRFVKSEMRYLISKDERSWIPVALVSTLVKYLAYQLGLYEKAIPRFIKKHIGVNKSFWRTKRAAPL